MADVVNEYDWTDVVNEYDWTEIPKNSPLRREGPVVYVHSYKLNSNQIMQSIKGYINVIAGTNSDGDSFYDKMYAESTTKEESFRFPFFSDSVRGFSNTFGDTFQNGIGGGGGLGEGLNNAVKEVAGVTAQILNMTDTGSIGTAIGQGVTAVKSAGDRAGAMNALSNMASTLGHAGNPGTYVETPMFYQFEKTDSPLDVSFTLYNTMNDDWHKNKELIDKLTKINRPFRKNSIAVDPPRIFKVKVPGVRFIRWAYCSSFEVNLLGNRRIINNEIIPDAYSIKMVFQSLTLEHSGFVDKANSGNS